MQPFILFLDMNKTREVPSQHAPTNGEARAYALEGYKWNMMTYQREDN